MITLTPIGTVRGTRDDLRDDHWGEVRARIEIHEDFPPSASAAWKTFRTPR